MSSSVPPIDDFTDQRVIITGGTRGIGRGMSRAFLRRGAHVTSTYSGNEEAAQSLRAEAGEDAARLTTVRFDVADHERVKAFFESLTVAPDVVIANAGIRRDAMTAMTSSEDWHRVLAVNLDGTFHVAKFAVRAMSRRRYGRIIFVTSPSAELGFEGQGAYAASKAGQVALMRVLAKEVASRQITVNCVSPGFVDTELLKDLGPDHKSKLLSTVPARRFGTEDEIASAVLFLASRSASYVSGAVLRVTGGL
ncbi:MAG: SDR family oxidoreductase [Deltaproteobacteria bacterium]|nr:SDR family oxidoreductase [Deltaproteobacteria bacterium]